MTSPVLHLIAGPNGAGKSSLYARLLGPATRLRFVNADVIAARRSFVTETVFSHPSKIELLEQARARGYLTTLHVVMVPEDLSVVRVDLRVRAGGHDVPEAKIRARHRRLFALLADAVDTVDETVVYDNSRAHPAFRVVARLERGRVVGAPDWPSWTPDALRAPAR